MRALRLGICALLTFSVLAFGAVEQWASAIIEVGAAALFLVWGIVSIRQRQITILGNCLYAPLLGFGAFVFLQEILQLSAYPYATKVEFVRGITYVLFLFVVVETARSADEFAGIPSFLLVLSFLVSLFGIVQSLTFNGKLYWFVVRQQGGFPFGPFVNHNHFAGFIELTVPLGLAELFGNAVPREKALLLILLTAIPTAALVLSASRGGISVLLLQAVLLGVLMRKQRATWVRFLPALGLALLAGALIAWLGAGYTVQRFESLASEGISHDQRLALLKDTWKIFLHHPWTGTGLGTLGTVYPAYQSFSSRQVVDHTHNDYVELLAETGVVGSLFFFLFLSLIIGCGVSNLRACHESSTRAVYAGALVGCAGLLAHGLVDFNFHVPSNVLLFMVLAALATSSKQKGEFALGSDKAATKEPYCKHPFHAMSRSLTRNVMSRPNGPP